MEKWKKYTITYQDLGDYTKQIDFKDTNASADVNGTYYTKQEEATKVILNIKETLPEGNYKIIARTNKNTEELSTKTFEIPKPTAKITHQEGKTYHIDYTNLRKNTVEIKVVKKQEQTELSLETDYTLNGSEPYVLMFKDTVAEGEYQIKAGIKGGDVLATEDVTIPGV